MIYIKTNVTGISIIKNNQNIKYRQVCVSFRPNVDSASKWVYFAHEHHNYDLFVVISTVNERMKDENNL